MRVSKSGGPTTVIASEHRGLRNIVVNDRHVYWAAHNGVWRWSKSTGSVEHIVDSPITAGSYALALDDRLLYWTDGSGIHRLPQDGGVGETVFASNADGILLNGSCLYVAVPTGLMRLSKSGGRATALSRWGDDDEFPASFAVDDAGVYWATSSNSLARVRQLPNHP